MEIIHLILGKANPNRPNGVNKVVHQLVSKQAEYGRNITLWGITKHLTHNYIKRNFETKLFQAKKNPFLLDKALRQAIKLKKGKAIFHLHGGWIPLYTNVAILLNKNNIPYVITPHGSYNTIAMQRNKWMKRLYFECFEKSILRNAQKIHLIGESEIQGIQRIFPNNKSFLLPYGFEPPQLKNVKINHKEDFIIGFVGRLDIYTKGLDLLINSFYEFQKSVPKSKLWIIGDSPEKSILEQLIANRNLHKKVVLWGSKFDAKKVALMQQIQVFVHPSRNEGLPSSVLEACSMGIPVVVTKATNLASYIAKNNAGIAIENEDEEALTKAFLKLFDMKNNKGLQCLSKNAKMMIHTVFNWNTTIKKFDSLYQ